MGFCSLDGCSGKIIFSEYFNDLPLKNAQPRANQNVKMRHSLQRITLYDTKPMQLPLAPLYIILLVTMHSWSCHMSSL